MNDQLTFAQWQKPEDSSHALRTSEYDDLKKQPTHYVTVAKAFKGALKNQISTRKYLYRHFGMPN
jgi:hypothetical protein